MKLGGENMPFADPTGNCGLTGGLQAARVNVGDKLTKMEHTWKGRV